MTSSEKMPFKFWLVNFNRSPFIKVYIHGASDLNGQPGSLATATVFFGAHPMHNTNSLGVPGRQTNQRAVLCAAIHALDVVVDFRENAYRHQRVAIFTNSDYPGQVWRRGWKWPKRTVANEDLVRLLLDHVDNFCEVRSTQNATYNIYIG